ncbi:MAG: hypothetical protein M1833_004525 [Piccolia ochrophora]|nr:MAG: hypothetical protein M1833_004525 [Piccolia ochrophora]
MQSRVPVAVLQTTLRCGFGRLYLAQPPAERSLPLAAIISSDLCPSRRLLPCNRLGFAHSTRAFHSSVRASFGHGSKTQQEKPTLEKNGEFRAKNVDEAIGEEKEKQARTPWHREGTDVSPVRRQRSAGAMTKGKLLTTPSRLLKLILPLTTTDKNDDRKDIEPLALLVHPQQPLSYLERLVQSELPLIRNAQGDEKIPTVYFLAEDASQDSMMPKKSDESDESDGEPAEEEGGRNEDLEETRIAGKVEKTGVLNKSKKDKLRGGHGEGGVESYSGLGRESPAGEDEGERKFVRWSSSTEIGDFIRDAARGREFGVEIEGTAKQIRVGVPSFNDRTYYLRTRLRKTSRKIADMADVKRECDIAAHKGGQRVAMSGFGLLVVWWYVVYRLTFETSLGWDVMEPVTYLVGLTTIMGGYLWFLYHNREISYKSALNLTISRRQTKLYNARGFDLQRWERLIDEGTSLRKEIKAIADEYDVEWDEKADEHSEKVTEALEENQEKQDTQAKNGKSAEKKQKKGKDDD